MRMRTVPELYLQECLESLARKKRITLDAPLFETLHSNGITALDELVDFRGKTYRELADAILAAVDYYEDAQGVTNLFTAVEKAAKTVLRGDYILLPDVDDGDEYQVGRALFLADTKAKYIPDWLEDYLDFEQIGHNEITNNHGCFTYYGYFAAL